MSSEFVAAFAALCGAFERRSYSKLVLHAEGCGWRKIERTSDAKLNALMQISDRGLAAGQAEGYLTGASSAAMTKMVAGRPLHLVVTHVRSTMLNQIGCYLYDFEAIKPVDAAEVTRLLGLSPASSGDAGGIAVTVWGPSPKFPGTLDTYLMFVRPRSAAVSEVGFDGVLLKTVVGAPKGDGGA